MEDKSRESRPGEEDGSLKGRENVGKLFPTACTHRRTTYGTYCPAPPSATACEAADAS